MRASTLFGLTIAILIGMAVVLGVKSSGLFSSPPAAAKAPDTPMILVAAVNLFEGLTATPNDVMIRKVEPGEMENYQRNKHKFMPALAQAAHLRTLARNVPANEPLLREHFTDLAFPASLTQTIRPGYRAVNLQLPRDRAGGGVIRKDDYVDVLFTTTYSTDGVNLKTATVPIALGLKVIVKRDSFFTMLQSLDETKPHSFTLEANPYRAALIEFTKEKGYHTIVATGPSVNDAKWGRAVTFDNKEEERLSDEILGGKSIGEQDIATLLRLPPIQVASAPPMGPQWPEEWHGVGRKNYRGPPGNYFQPTVSPGYSFKAPAAPATQTPGCATCGKKS